MLFNESRNVVMEQPAGYTEYTDYWLVVASLYL